MVENHQEQSHGRGFPHGWHWRRAGKATRRGSGPAGYMAKNDSGWKLNTNFPYFLSNEVVKCPQNIIHLQNSTGRESESMNGTFIRIIPI